MALTLITGGSGAGKTEYIYRKIIDRSMREPGTQFFLLVPEQATMQAQKEIVRLHPNHGTMNIDIVSFERLAYRIFSELALPQPELLDDTAKTMVLRKLAGEKRDDLVLFSSHLNQAGFIDEVKSMLSELCQYGVTPDMLSGQLADRNLSPVLERKLADMNVIYRAFLDFTKERYITMEELLDVLCGVCGRSRLLKDSVMVLDGYTGFTPIQYRLIGLLLSICSDMFVTVTATGGTDLFAPGNETDLFDMSRKMAGKLSALAAENGKKVYTDDTAERDEKGRFTDSPALAYLEKTFFRYPYAPYRGETEEITLLQAENPSDEVDYVLNKIHCLVKKEGYRYRDIGIVCGDMEGYSRELIHQFEENGIPLFLDEKKDVSGNPLARLINSLLEILQRGFDYESMFQYLRTGLVTGEKEKIDRMEIYVRAMGIRGYRRWDSVWERPFGDGDRLNLAELNEFKESVMAPLRTFRDMAGERGTDVMTMTKAIVTVLETLEAEKKLAEQSKAFSEAGMDREAREYGEIYGLVMDLFTRYTELLGTERVSRKEYLEILNAGISELSVGMIPATADRVVAGDLKRTRLDKIKALFFIGVNEGVVPSDASKGGILTEQEREILKKNSLELAPTAREEGFMQRFYLYLVMTKPSEKLTVSWTTVSAEGKAMRPSGLVGQMKKRFPDVPVRIAEKERDHDVSINSARRSVIGWLEEPELIPQDKEAAVRYCWLANKAGLSHEMERLSEACVYSYTEHGIGREAAGRLYGDILNGSVTRMEGYAACAYAHFLAHGLGLRKRQEYELDLSDMGNLFHSSIDRFFSEVRSQGLDFRTIDEPERKKLVKSCVQQVAEEYRNTIMKSSARNTYLERKVERIADRTIRALIHQIQKGDFEPEAFEVDVSTRIDLDGGGALNLRGRIDRMDIYEDDDKVYVKIMDYKSGSTSFDLALLYHGLQLQLVVYMDAAITMEKRRHPKKEVVPAGIFYYHIDDPVIERQEELSEEEIEAQILKKLRMNGLVNSSLDVIRHMDRDITKESDVIPVAIKDGLIQESKSSVAGGKRFANLSGFVNESLKKMGAEIMDGNVSVNPYKQGKRTACDYCPYHGVCGFDMKTSGYGYRKFKSMKAEEIWEKIDPAEEEGEEENG